MQKRKLGKAGLEVSAIGFGCMGLNFCLRARSRQAERRFDHPNRIRRGGNFLRYRGGLRSLRMRKSSGRLWHRFATGS